MFLLISFMYTVSCKNFEDLRLVFTGNRNISPNNEDTCSYAILVGIDTA